MESPAPGEGVQGGLRTCMWALSPLPSSATPSLWLLRHQLHHPQKNEAAKTKALDQYGKVSAKFATAARNDPLHTAAQMKGAEVAAHKFVAADAYESGSKEATEFSWRDEDMAGDTVVIPEALRAKLAVGGGGGAAAASEAESGAGADSVLERAGDTRKKNIEEAKKKRAADVADRAAKRTKQMEELQEKSDRAVLSHVCWWWR